jgi:hypothetical protein
MSLNDDDDIIFIGHDFNTNFDPEVIITSTIRKSSKYLKGSAKNVSIEIVEISDDSCSNDINKQEPQHILQDETNVIANLLPSEPALVMKTLTTSNLRF